MDKLYLDCKEKNMGTEAVRLMKIEVLVVLRNDCKDCDELVKNLELLSKDISGIKLVIFNLDKADKTNTYDIPIKVFITPALFVNGKLKCYGSVSVEKLKKSFLNNLNL